jgi:hypothetical protein
MVKISLVLTLLCLTFVLSCQGPEDIVFGPDPIRQLREPNEMLEELSIEDRAMLEGYLNSIEVAKSFKWPVKSAEGLKLGEVLNDARVWEKRVKKQQAEEEDRLAEEKKRQDEMKATAGAGKQSAK